MSEQLDQIRRAVEMTAMCKRVEYDWKALRDFRWVAELWCNEIGQTVLGFGPDAWAAVQSAHALKSMAEQGRYRPGR